MQLGDAKWQPKEGETVWVYYLNPSNRHGGVTAVISARKFERVIPNYLGKEGNERWVLVLPTGELHKNYGTAYRPWNVYPTASQALSMLQVAVKDKIKALEDALYEALKGGGSS
jgi:hypothetical protein